MTFDTQFTTPFFIVGFSRSGTTLLAAMLDSQGDICVTPETRFCFGVPPFARPDQSESDHDTIIERVFGFWRTSDLKVDREEFEHLFREQHADYGRAFACLLECYRRKSGERLIGEKSPVHLLYVDTLLRWFPGAVVLCIVRDGRDVVESMINAPFGHKNRIRHAAEWTYQSTLCRELHERYPENVFVIQFEDLLQETEEALGKIGGWVGASVEKDQFDANATSAVIPEWERSWKQQALESVDSSRVALWTDRPLTPFYSSLAEGIMEKELDEWGYVRDGRLARRPVRRLMAQLLSPLFRGHIYRIMRRVSQAVRVALLRFGLRRHL